MNIDKILNHPLISRAELARRMYPQLKDKKGQAGTYLYNKINAVQRQSLTFKDRELIKKIIKDLFAELE